MSAVVIAETLRRHLTSPAYLIFLILIASTGLLAATFNKPAAMWPGLVWVVATIIGSALIGPELSSGALQLIVIRPITRSAYLLSRAAGVFAAVTLAATLPLIAEPTLRVLLHQPDVPWQRFGEVYGAALAIGLLTISLLAMLGAMTRAYMNVGIYIGAQALFSTLEAIAGALRVRGTGVGVLLERHPEIEQTMVYVDDLLFPSVPAAVTATFFLRCAAVAAVALGIGCVVFQRREVPYGAD